MERGLNIGWVIATGFQFDPIVDVDRIKDIGPIWGSWTTWRGCGTDNVICHDRTKAKDLVDNGFQSGCNLYVPESVYQELQRPIGVRPYGGNFEYQVANIEDIVALHLAGSSLDIILMLGFDLYKLNPNNKHYYGLILSFVNNNPDIQIVLIDHLPDLDKNFQDRDNLTCDTLGNVLQLLAQ